MKPKERTPTIYSERAENLGRKSLPLAPWGWDDAPMDDDEDNDDGQDGLRLTGEPMIHHELTKAEKIRHRFA